MSTEVHAVAQHAVLYALMRQQLLDEMLQTQGVGIRDITVDDRREQIRLGPITGRARLVAQVTGSKVRWAHGRKLAKLLGPDPVAPLVSDFGQRNDLGQLVADEYSFPAPPGMDPNVVMANVGHELGILAIEVLGKDFVYQVLPTNLGRRNVYAVDRLSMPVRDLELADVVTLFPRAVPMITQLDHALGGLGNLTGWAVGKGPDRDGGKREYRITDQSGAWLSVDFTFDRSGGVTHLHFDGVHAPGSAENGDSDNDAFWAGATGEDDDRGGSTLDDAPSPERESPGVIPSIRRAAQHSALPVMLRQHMLQRKLRDAGLADRISVEEQAETIWFGEQRARARLVALVGDKMLVWGFAKRLQGQLGSEPVAHLMQEYGKRNDLIEVWNEYIPWSVPVGMGTSAAITRLAHDIGVLAVQALGKEFVYQVLHTPSGIGQLVFAVDQLPLDVPPLRLGDVAPHLPAVINELDDLDRSLEGLSEATGWRVDDLSPSTPDQRRIRLSDGAAWISFELTFGSDGTVEHLHFEGNLT